jgi:hypothetical protein
MMLVETALDVNAFQAVPKPRAASQLHEVFIAPASIHTHMQQVKFLKARLYLSRSYAVNEVATLDLATAQDAIRRGLAVPHVEFSVVPPKAVETATIEPRKRKKKVEPATEPVQESEA